MNNKNYIMQGFTNMFGYKEMEFDNSKKLWEISRKINQESIQNIKKQQTEVNKLAKKFLKK